MKFIVLFALVAVAFAADTTKDNLIKDAGKLRGEADSLIKKLEGEGKHLLAAEIKVLDEKLHALEKQVESLHPTTEVGKVALHAAESILKGLEAKLEAKIKSLGGAFYDNTKDNLIKDAGKLRGEADALIKKLKGEGKHTLAAEIQILDNKLHALEKQVESLHPHTEAGKVALHAAETILKGLEAKLEKKIKELNGAFYDTTKDNLIKDAGKLRGEADALIKKLKGEGKHTLAAEIQILDNKLHQLEKQVESLHPHTEAGKVALHAAETLLKGLEAKLEKKIKELNGAFYDNTKEELIKDAGKLRKEAAAEIAKLKAQGKHLLAAELEVLDKKLISLEHEVEKLHPTTEAGKVALHAAESVLKGLEAKLAAKLKSLSGSFYDTKEELIKDASKLREQANSAIAKLKAEGKHLLAAEIEVLDKKLHQLEEQVHNLHPTTEVGKIALHAAEAVLKGLETKLEAKLKSLSGSFYDTKEELIKDASKLREQANSAIAKLKAEGKHLLAAEIEVLDKKLHQLEEQVHNLHPTTEVGKIALHAAESVLKGLETKLEAKLKSLSGSFYDTKEDLIKDAGKLRGEAAKEIAKLKAEGKHLLAAELEVLDKKLIALEQQVEKLHPTTEAGKVALHAAESVLKGLEAKLAAELKKLGGK